MVSAKTGVTKITTGEVIDALLETIESALKAEEKVKFVGFGVFEIKERAAKVGRNPRTNKEVRIPARKVPVFTPSKMLKESTGGDLSEGSK